MITRVNGIALHYELHGDGEPLLFIHGFPLSGTMWQPVAPLLKDAWRLIIPDFRGHGRTEATPTATMAQFADDLAGLLDAIGERRPVVLVGLSMGGYIAFELLRRHPGRVRALVLVDTQHKPDTEEKSRERAALAERVLKEGSRIVGDAMVDKLFAPGAPAGLREEWRGIMAATSPVGVAAALRAMADRADSLPTLRDMTVPCLIVVGESDAITPPDLSRAMHEAAAGSQLAVVPGAGHMTPVEKPEAFAGILTGFLRTLPALR